MTVADKNNHNFFREITFLEDIWGYLGPHNYVSMRKRGTRCIAPKLQWANFEGSKTQRGQFAFNLCLAEFWIPQSAPRGAWTPQSLPRGVLEQCNVCPAFS